MTPDIQIARFFDSPELKAKIQERIDSFSICTTSLIVRQEFKRRVMKEAKYLLSCIQRLGSFSKVRRWVDSVLPTQMNRKRNICLELLDTVGEVDHEKESDKDTTDRAKLMLEGLIEFGMSDFDNSVDFTYSDSGCACAQEPVRIDADGRVSLGKDKCSQVANDCRVAAFLSKNTDAMSRVRDAIKNASPADLTEELNRSRAFIEEFLADPKNVESRNPCSTVGDLLIALESQAVKEFYTLNEKESKTLCPCFGQSLIVRPKNYVHPDKLI